MATGAFAAMSLILAWMIVPPGIFWPGGRQNPASEPGTGETVGSDGMRVFL